MYSVLQNKSLEIVRCITAVSDTIKDIASLRNDFGSLYESVVGEPQLKRGVPDICLYYKQQYIEIIDTTCSQLRDRYAHLSELKFVELLNPTKFDEHSQKYPTDLMKSLQNSYDLFDMVKLKAELNVIFKSSVFRGKSVNELYKIILNHDLCSELSEVYRLANLILSLPSTTVSVERDFSTLKRLKTFARNSMGQDRLSGLATMCIEKVILNEIKWSDDFYNKVINKFCEKSRRAEFIYKS